MQNIFQYSAFLTFFNFNLYSYSETIVDAVESTVTETESVESTFASVVLVEVHADAKMHKKNNNANIRFIGNPF